jgi:formate-nitrite transporter family protein
VVKTFTRKTRDPRDLSERERREAGRHAALTAATVHEAIRLEGEDELARSSAALAWSGLAAGLSMGFSLITQGVIWPYLPDAPWRPLISRLGYSVGFIIVVLGRQQLFTENTLTPMLPLFTLGGIDRLRNVGRLWAVVLAANLLGCLAVAWLISHTSVFPPEAHQAFAAISRESTSGDFWRILVKGVFAGWLIASMVWLLPFAESARVTVIVAITYVLALGGFTHIVAGSVDAFYLWSSGAMSVGPMLFHFMVPTLIGNIIGGVSLVAAINHAQVVAGADRDR